MVGMRLSERASLYLAKIRKMTLVDIQAIRAKLLQQLEGLLTWRLRLRKDMLNGFEMRKENSMMFRSGSVRNRRVLLLTRGR